MKKEQNEKEPRTEEQPMGKETKDKVKQSGKWSARSLHFCLLLFFTWRLDEEVVGVIPFV